MKRWLRRSRGDRSPVHVRVTPRSIAYLTLLIGSLSLATGIAHIASPVAIPFIDPYTPDVVRELSGFTGTVTGFLLLLSALGLRERLRFAAQSTLVLLPASALQGVLQASPVSLPLVILSLAAIPIVYRHRAAFDRRTTLEESQLAAAAALLGVLAYGTVGSFALREQFGGIDTMLDAFYYTLVTASTVGYGDIAPNTQVARLFALSIVVLGATSFVLAAGVLIGPILESRFKVALGKMSSTELDELDDHVLVLGTGDLTHSILAGIDDRAEIVVITRDNAVATTLTDRGLNVIIDDPMDERALGRAQLETARAVIAATDDDGADALAVLTVRRVNPDVFVVAAATNEQNIGKLRDAGANTVISPTAIGAQLLATSAVDGTPIEDVDGLRDGKER